MKKKYVSPHIEVLRIKQGNVVMNSHGGLICPAENESCTDTCHECSFYCDDFTT